MDDRQAHDVQKLFGYGLKLALPTIEGYGPTIEVYGSEQRDRRLQRHATIALLDFDCDHTRLKAATEGCVTRRDERAARDIPAALDGYATAVAVGQAAIALLRERDAEAAGPAGDALRAELEESLDTTHDQNMESLWRRPRLNQRIVRQLNAWRRAYSNRRVDSWAWLEHHGPDHPAGVERIMIHLSSKKSRQGAPTDKVRMYYRTCHSCRRVLLGKMTVNNPSHRGLGLGTHAIRHVMEEIPGYTWYTSVQRDSAVSYWTLMAERTGAGFIGPERGVDIRCEHIHTVEAAEVGRVRV